MKISKSSNFGASFCVFKSNSSIRAERRIFGFPASRTFRSFDTSKLRQTKVILHPLVPPPHKTLQQARLVILLY
ncbi:hypothetical protein Avbf_11228 [Armadillidium vulgare]|nr:hypothetical protein Avbf_11228 [Armadillidium vulgare]